MSEPSSTDGRAEDGALEPTRRAATETPYLEASRIEGADGRYRARLYEDWLQGRGVYGGMVGALLTRALEAVEPERPLRTLELSLRAPARPGPVELSADSQRVGRSVAFGEAELRSAEGALIASARATFASDRPSALSLDDRERPSMPSAAEVSDGPQALYFPEFCRHLELRQALGPPPFSGAASAQVGGWCRLRSPSAADRALLVALLDAWPPAALGCLERWCPAATVDATIQFLSPPDGVAEDAFYGFEASGGWAAGGYTEERASLFGPDGQQLAIARQWVAIFAGR